MKEDFLQISLPRTGSIEVIVGSMFSGKTEELIRLLKRAQLAKQNVQVFKPRIDDRYSPDKVASHNKSLFQATVIDHAAEIFQHIKPDTHVIGIDEGQFFDAELVAVADQLADRGLRVIVAGLDLDYRGTPFHPMPELMAIAEHVQKLHAICVVCGALASRTQRLIDSDAPVLVGDHKAYEARCRSCYSHEIEVAREEHFDEELDTIQIENLMAQPGAARLDS